MRDAEKNPPKNEIPDTKNTNNVKLENSRNRKLPNLKNDEVENCRIFIILPELKMFNTNKSSNKITELENSRNVEISEYQ